MLDTFGLEPAIPSIDAPARSGPAGYAACALKGIAMRRFLLAFAIVAVTVGTSVGSVQARTSSGWSIVRTPNAVSSALHYGSLDAVACATTSACIAVGSGVNDRANGIAIAASWNGTAWVAEPTAHVRGAAAAVLSAVSCIAANACIAVGDELDGADTALPLIERWDGTAWSVEPSPAGRGGSLVGVSCVNATACMAVGDTSNPTGATVALAERWDGVTWSIVPTPSIPGAPYTVTTAVSCSAAAAFPAVGSTTAPVFGAVAERWNGSVLSLAAMSTPCDRGEGFDVSEY